MRSRDLELLVGAVFLSALGDWLALWAPLVVFAGPAGLAVDRFDTRRVIVLASVAQAAVAVALAFTGSLAPILVLTVLLGAANAVSQPAEFALIPAVVPDERLGIANAHVETARFAGFAAGPVLGGILSGVGGTRLPLLVDAASFVVIALVVVALRRRRSVAATAEEQVGRARDGIVFLARDRTLRLVMVVAFAS